MIFGPPTPPFNFTPIRPRKHYGGGMPEPAPGKASGGAHAGRFLLAILIPAVLAAGVAMLAR